VESWRLDEKRNVWREQIQVFQLILFNQIAAEIGREDFGGDKTLVDVESLENNVGKTR
jgi:hypothetical protein